MVKSIFSVSTTVPTPPGLDLSDKVTLNGFYSYWIDVEWCLVTAATQLKGNYKTGDGVNVTVKTYADGNPGTWV